MQVINSRQSLDAFKEHLEAQFEKHGYLRVDLKTGKQRTDKQRKALELYCKFIAEKLNEEGVTFQMFFKPGIEVPWTQQIVKDNVWRPVQQAMTGDKSTTKPHTDQYPKIYEVVNRKLTEFGFYIPWPCKEQE